ncbi:WD40/YVTN/BNR-like repeat-containing protein [Dechloromonas sp. ARDL1]|uniref:WD40/YVTN/BNR-like repeat-containing protein n=1 Tax=Dechloromonas sp. ARDL1 TaxID=3322121 RepID=UPI003DA6FD2F
MRRIFAARQWPLGLAMTGLLLSACTQAPDMSGIASERERPLKRYDISQAIAANDKVIVVGTQSGVVLVSTDKGATWRRQALGQTSLIDIAVCTDQTFVAIDHYHKLWSADAEGKVWQSVKLEQPRTPLAVACSPQGGWWVAGTNAVIAGTADQGKTWQVTDLGEDTQITTLQFIDDKRAVALGEFGITVTSDDGGATWKKGPKIPGDFYPYAALFRDGREGWVSGIAGQMLHTRDGGQTWQKQVNATQAALNRLFMHDGVPYGVGSGGIVARLEGDSWRNVPYPDPLPMFLGGGASLPGQAAIVIGGPGGLLRTVGTANNK